MTRGSADRAAAQKRSPRKEVRTTAPCDRARGSTCHGLFRKLVSVYLRFDRREPAIGGILQPELEGRCVEVVVQAPTRGIADQFVHEPVQRTLPVAANGNAIESDSQIVAHELYAPMVLSAQPGQGGIARKEIRPTLQG